MKTNILLLFILILMGSRIKGQDHDSLSGHKIHSVSLQFGLNLEREMRDVVINPLKIVNLQGSNYF
jgi:hypothetical protein